VLYAGCRTPSDALYATELQEWQASGAVEVRYSYSRLHPDTGPKYVQDLVWHDREHFKQLWDKGAKILVCGSHGLSSGVKDTVRRIYTTYLEEESSQADKIGLEEWWVDILRDRYITDIWG
jgi:cytochrome P450/NADPH-cytochrome P450 reductase